MSIKMHAISMRGLLVFLISHQEMQYYGLTRGRVVNIPLDGKFQQILLDPEVYRYAWLYRSSNK